MSLNLPTNVIATLNTEYGPLADWAPRYCPTRIPAALPTPSGS